MLDNIKIPEKLPDCIEEPIKEATLSPAKEFGKGLAEILAIVFYPTNTISEKLKIKQKHNLKQYEKIIMEKYNKIPEEKKIEPNFQIVASALEASKYSLDEEIIRNMYATLIVNSMNSDFSEDVHPSYSEIIKQLSPQDASNLSLFKYNSNYPIARYIIRNEQIDRLYKVIETNIFLENKLYKDIYSQSVSISNLERLNLVEISYSKFIKKSNNDSDNIYSKFEDTVLYQKLKKDFKSDIGKGIVNITPYGSAFLRICYE